MSNYNTQLQSNNTNLQTVLQTLQTKATGSGEQEDAFITKAISGSYFNDRVTTVGGGVFAGCKDLTAVSFPACTTIDCASIPGNDHCIGAFQYCINLTTASFPVCISIESNAFYACKSLTTVSFPACTNLGGNAFFNCYNLKSLYLTGSKVCKLASIKAFTSTPIGGYSASAGTYGSIYVPASLLTSYQTTTNWAYFSDRFVAYDDNTNTGGDTGGIITFTINGTSYKAENGMTWGEWVESKYNTDNYTVDPEESMYIMDYQCNGFVQFENNYVGIDEVIQDSTNYAFGW